MMKIRQKYFENGELSTYYVRAITDIVSRYGTDEYDNKNDFGIIESDIKTHIN